MKRFLLATIVAIFSASCLPSTVAASQPTTVRLSHITQVLHDPNPSPVYDTWIAPDPTAAQTLQRAPGTYDLPTLSATGQSAHQIPGPCRNNGTTYQLGGVVTDSNSVHNIDGVYGRSNMHVLWPCWNPNGSNNDSSSFVLPANLQRGSPYDWDIVQLGYYRRYAAANSPYVFCFTKYDHGAQCYDWSGHIPAIQTHAYAFTIYHVAQDSDGIPNWYYQITDLTTGQQEARYGGDWPCVPPYSCTRGTWTSGGSTGFAWYGFETHDWATVMDDVWNDPAQLVAYTTYRIAGSSWYHNCAVNAIYPQQGWYLLFPKTTYCSHDSVFVWTQPNGTWSP